MLTDIQITLNPECTIDVQARLNYFKNHAAMENLDYDHSGHTGFASKVYADTELAKKVDKISGSSLVPDTKVSSYDSHLTNVSNPHSVTKSQVGLGNVDNTSDANKPISTATQTALNEKQDNIKTIAFTSANVVKAGRNPGNNTPYITFSTTSAQRTILEDLKNGIIKVDLTAIQQAFSLPVGTVFIKQNAINVLSGLTLIQYEFDFTGFEYGYAQTQAYIVVKEIGGGGAIYESTTSKYLFISFTNINPTVMWTRIGNLETGKADLVNGKVKLDQIPSLSYVSISEKGAVNGVATLGGDGQIPSSQLPSYVDDVIDFEKQVTGADFIAQILATDLGSMVWIAAAKSHTGDTYYRKFAINNDGTQAGITLVTPESGKIYVGKTDTNCFRWSGTNLVEISKSLAIGETASTAYAGNKGKANADAIAAIKNGTTMNDFASVETAIHAIVNIYYPVGSIYLSVNSTNPGTLFGGTWEQIKDKFLLAAGDNHSAGSTGGSEDAVTVSHSHSYSGTTSSNGSHMHTGLSRRGLNGSSYTGVESGTAYNGTLDYEVDPYIHTSSDGAHTHTYSGTVGSSGESGTGKNMPPYLTVYMWKRTA